MATDTYHLLVREARDARQARRRLSNFFLALNLIGFAAIAFLASDFQSSPTYVWIAAALFLACLVWRTAQTYYARQLAAKYKVLYAAEQRKGVDFFQREWRTLGRQGRTAFTLERALPVLFMLSHLSLIAVQFPDALDFIFRLAQPLFERFAA